MVDDGKQRLCIKFLIRNEKEKCNFSIIQKSINNFQIIYRRLFFQLKNAQDFNKTKIIF